MMMSMIMKNINLNHCKDNLPDHVHIFDVEHFETIKPKLLGLISKMITSNNISLNNKGYYYDFDIPDVHKPYQQLFFDTIKKPISIIEEMYGLKIKNQSRDASVWFQQYEQGSDFGWHEHGGHFAVILYVELPEMTESTEFLNYGQFNVKEGQVLFFPTFLLHRSPTIKSKLRKTIISVNLNFTVDRDMIELYGKEYFKH